LIEAILHLLKQKTRFARPAHPDHRLGLSGQQGHGDMPPGENRELLAGTKGELFLKGGSLGSGHLSCEKRQFLVNLSLLKVLIDVELLFHEYRRHPLPGGGSSAFSCSVGRSGLALKRPNPPHLNMTRTVGADPAVAAKAMLLFNQPLPLAG
jgi:hypothetical protein